MLSHFSLMYPRCSHCRSIDFRDVGTRNFLERAFSYLLQPCRCTLCGQHFFRLRW